MAIWEPLGVVLGSIWESFWARHAIFAKIAPRHSESTNSRISGGPKKAPKRIPKQLPAVTWLHILGPILGPPNRSKHKNPGSADLEAWGLGALPLGMGVSQLEI